MPSMPPLPAPLRLLLVLWMALSPGCCKKSPPPVLPVVQVQQKCVTPELLARRPKPMVEWVTDCSSRDKTPEDCVTTYAKTLAAYLDEALANCGVKP